MDKKFISLMAVFFIVFGVFMTSILFNRQLGSFARASTETDPSPSTSLIFAWPLTAKVGEKVNVNVFVRNIKNSPLNNQQVKLKTNLGLVNGTMESSAESDKTGKVSFVLTSNSSGIAELTAFVSENIPLIQKVSVKFD